MILKEDERIDDLQLKGYKIIQKKSGFCFGQDAVLLANFVRYKKNDTVCDLGTGTGIIPIILAAKANLEKIYAVEIQKEVSDMAKRSVEMNNLKDRIDILNMNLKDAPEFIGKNSVDIVTCNPPYMPKEKLLSGNEMQKISRNEIFCDIQDVFRSASQLLKDNGKLFMVHRPTRLSDIFYYSRMYKMEAKMMQLVHPRVQKSANLVLMQFTKNAKPELKMLEPLYIYEQDTNEYTKKIREIYSQTSIKLDTQI